MNEQDILWFSFLEREKYLLTSRWCFSRIRLSRDRTSIREQLRRKT